MQYKEVTPSLTLELERKLRDPGIEFETRQIYLAKLGARSKSLFRQI